MPPIILYTDSLAAISAEQLQGGFFDGWPNPPSPETHLRLLKGSAHAVVAIDDTTGNVVGFITAITDGVLSAYIPLLEVLPAYKGHGIGQELTRRMLEILKPYYMVDLLCDKNLQPFYSKLGMRQAQGMFVRNFKAQGGIPE